MTAMKSNIENPISGYPHAVLRLDKVTFKVEVAAHCTNWAQATSTVDQLTDDPAKVEYMIVHDHQLVQQLVLQRKLMAQTMERALGVG
jgi:hypothetical protein